MKITCVLHKKITLKIDDNFREIYVCDFSTVQQDGQINSFDTFPRKTFHFLIIHTVNEWQLWLLKYFERCEEFFLALLNLQNRDITKLYFINKLQKRIYIWWVVCKWCDVENYHFLTSLLTLNLQFKNLKKIIWSLANPQKCYKTPEWRLSETKTWWR